jgi:hypothetical protein
VTHFLALSLFDAKASTVLDAAIAKLSQYQYQVSPVGFPPLPGQDYSHNEPRATVWAPDTCPRKSALIAHLPDGWNSLTTRIHQLNG